MPKPFFLWMVVLVLPLVGCENKSQNQAVDAPVAKVNNYTITLKDVNQEAGSLRPVFQNITSLSSAVLDEGVLDNMIMREVLLEEAQKLKIDREEAFMRQVESFWRWTLIKELWARKTQEIAAHTKVTDEEVAQDFERLSEDMKEAKPIEKMDAGIRATIFNRKVQNALQAWVDVLKAQATIIKYAGDAHDHGK